MDKKQKILIEYMLSSPDLYAKCKTVIDSKYFDPEFRLTLDFMDEYYEGYRALPDISLIESVTDMEYDSHEITKDKFEYCCNEIESYCRKNAVISAIRKGVELLETEDYGVIEKDIRDALAVSITKDLGLDYFDDPQTRLEEQLAVSPKISTGWKDVDELTGGGLHPTEFFMVSANSGGGKSLWLANLGLNLAIQGHDVVYFSLELPEWMVAQRYDMMITEIPSAPRQIWEQNFDNILDRIRTFKSTPNTVDGGKIGSIHIKRIPTGSTANTMRSYLKEYTLRKGKSPTLIIVDYLDLVDPIDKVSKEAIFTKDKIAAENVRELGFEFEAIVATASQQNRSSLDRDVGEQSQSGIAGGISKVNTVDTYASIIMNDQMRRAGEMKLHFLKTRSSDGVGRTVDLTYNPRTLRITDAIESDTKDMQLAIDKQKAKSSKRTVKDIDHLISSL